MNLLHKPEIHIANMQQLDAYISAEHGTVNGRYWDPMGDGADPYWGKYSRRIDEKVDDQSIVFKTSWYENYTGNPFPYERCVFVINPSIIATDGIRIFSRKKLAN